MHRLIFLSSLLALVGCAAQGGPTSGDTPSSSLGKADGSTVECSARSGTYDDVDVTEREAQLILQMANAGSAEVLDVTIGAGLDADTVRNVVAARADGEICNMDALAAVPEMGPANMERARQFSAIWETAVRDRAIGARGREGELPKVDDFARRLIASAGTFDGTAYTVGEARAVLELVNNASVTQLDGIPYFRSDAAREVIDERRDIGRFENLEQVAAVFGVGTRHMEYLIGAIADWRRFGRTAELRCAELRQKNEMPDFGTDACPDVEGRTFAGGEVEDVTMTGEEVTLIIDFVNTASFDLLNVVLDERAAEGIVIARERGPICDLGTLGGAYWVGPAGLETLRRFSVTWEAHRAGESLEDLMDSAERPVAGVDPLNENELAVLVEMANYASEEQLDTMGSFRSDAARALVYHRAQNGAFATMSDIEAVDGMGPAHINYMVEHVADWRRFLREMDQRGSACADFLTTPPPITPLLSAEDERAVLDGLDNICPDTFCGGDLDYWMMDLSCDGSGICELSYRVEPRYSGEQWTATGLDGIDAAALSSSGVSDSGSDWSGTVSEMFELDGLWWARVDCTMHGFNSRDDIVRQRQWGRTYSEKIYDELVFGCLDGMESALWRIPSVPRADEEE